MSRTLGRYLIVIGVGLSFLQVMPNSTASPGQWLQGTVKEYDYNCDATKPSQTASLPIPPSGSNFVIYWSNCLVSQESGATMYVGKTTDMGSFQGQTWVYGAAEVRLFVSRSYYPNSPSFILTFQGPASTPTPSAAASLGPTPSGSYTFGPPRTVVLKVHGYLSFKDQAYVQAVNQYFEVNYLSFLNYWGENFTEGGSFKSSTDPGYSGWSKRMTDISNQVLAQISPVRKISPTPTFTKSHALLLKMLAAYEDLFSGINKALPKGSILTKSGQASLTGLVSKVQTQRTAWAKQYFKDAKLPIQIPNGSPSFVIVQYAASNSAKAGLQAVVQPTVGFDPVLDSAATYQYQWYKNNAQTLVSSGSVKVVDPLNQVLIQGQFTINQGDDFLLKVRAVNSSGAGPWSDFGKYTVQ